MKGQGKAVLTPGTGGRPASWSASRGCRRRRGAERCYGCRVSARRRRLRRLRSPHAGTLRHSSSYEKQTRLACWCGVPGARAPFASKDISWWGLIRISSEIDRFFCLSTLAVRGRSSSHSSSPPPAGEIDPPLLERHHDSNSGYDTNPESCVCNGLVSEGKAEKTSMETQKKAEEEEEEEEEKEEETVGLSRRRRFPASSWTAPRR